jgi:hypothetical protein
MAIERREPAHNLIAVYRSERYSLSVIEICARHLLVHRHHDAVTVDVTGDVAVTVDVTGDDAAKLRGLVERIEESGLVVDAAYTMIDMLYVHPVLR